MSSVTNIIFISSVVFESEIQLFIECLKPITQKTAPFVYHDNSGGSKAFEAGLFTAAINYLDHSLINEAITNLKENFEEFEFEDFQIGLKKENQDNFTFCLVKDFTHK